MGQEKRLEAAREARRLIEAARRHRKRRAQRKLAAEQKCADEYRKRLEKEASLDKIDKNFIVRPVDEKHRVGSCVLVAVGKPGVTVLHPESEKKIQFFPFTQIKSWLDSAQAFGLEVLDGKQEARTLWFQTRESKDICAALKACVDEIVADVKKE